VQELLPTPEERSALAQRPTPMQRWHRMANEFGDGDLYDPACRAMADAESATHLYSLEKALTDATPPELMPTAVTFISAASDAALRGAQRAYDLGFGDGWHAGALAAVRLIAGGQGLQVPQISEAFGVAVGLELEAGNKGGSMNHGSST
jgi:hypothetical protein